MDIPRTASSMQKVLEEKSHITEPEPEPQHHGYSIANASWHVDDPHCVMWGQHENLNSATVQACGGRCRCPRAATWARRLWVRALTACVCTIWAMFADCWAVRQRRVQAAVLSLEFRNLHPVHTQAVL